MADKTWKAFERAFAFFWGGERTPLSGSNSKQTTGDMIHPQIYAECKTGKLEQRIPAFFRNLMKKTSEEAKKEGKMPCIGFRLKGKCWWILIRSRDFDKFVEIKKLCE